MILKLIEFQTIISNYNAKSSIEPEIFGIFQHKVERTPHFARVSEVRHVETAIHNLVMKGKMQLDSCYLCITFHINGNAKSTQITIILYPHSCVPNSRKIIL